MPSIFLAYPKLKWLPTKTSGDSKTSVLLLDVNGVPHTLVDPQLTSYANDKIQQSWQHANKIWSHTILQTISNKLFDVYYSYNDAKIIWEALIKQFTAEDATEQKFIVGKYYY